ncbi:MAG: LacI family DNA-binding transcriptional regulator [Phycisphaerales bacterium]|nr:LacI family DNA-binding transcriptional regulator [Phycisphaerales bacterium]
MSSIRKIAQKAGVSITTVSRALNNDRNVSAKTRELVLTVANRSGYVSKVGRRTTTNIGFAYAGRQTLSSVFDSALLEGITHGVDNHQFDIVLLKPQRDKDPDETYTQFFMRKGVRGVILRTTAESREVCVRIAEEQFPLVVISERFDADNVNFVDCESRTESMRAVDYLVSLGHRRIGIGMHTIPDCDHLDRYDGYCQSLANAGIALEEQYIFRHPANLAGGATILKMAMSMADRPTAIYFSDPQLAVGAINKAHELGVRIPRDLSIVGFDDAEARYSVYPTMTAVCQDARALGVMAATSLTRMINDGSKERIRETIPSFFEVHRSTAPPPDDPRPIHADNGRGD